MISKMLPFLNKLIPVPLAIKGLQKLNPKMNQLFANAAGVGYGAEEVMDFLREQTSPKQRDPSLRPDEAAAQSRIEQGTQIPELLGNVGGAALGGAGIASIPEVIGTLFDQKEEEQLPESEKRRLEALQKFKEKKKKRSVMEEERERFNAQYPQSQQFAQVEQPQQKSNEQAMMIAIQKLLEFLG